MKWLVLGVLLAAGVVAFDAGRQLTAPLPISEPKVVDVARGASLRLLLERWLADGLLDNRRQLLYLSAYARLTGQDTAIKSGEYEVKPGMAAVDLASLLVAGQALMHQLLIVEGWTFEQALAAINADRHLAGSGDPLTAESVMQALGQPGQHPEGRFYPDTYRFAKGASRLSVLRQAYEQMRHVLDAEWRVRDADTILETPEEALVLASIIEKETGLASERTEISGVFIRRLLKGMRLQTDPTVIYGLGAAFDGNLRRRDLEADTPYNTYTRAGLPPTPICLPGRASIHAALHPKAGDSLYFVARGDGSHQFSATIEEHNAAVRKYQLKGRSR